jgi:hypothetical protein
MLCKRKTLGIRSPAITVGRAAPRACGTVWIVSRQYSIARLSLEWFDSQSCDKLLFTKLTGLVDD